MVADGRVRRRWVAVGGATVCVHPEHAADESQGGTPAACCQWASSQLSRPALKKQRCLTTSTVHHLTFLQRVLGLLPVLVANGAHHHQLQAGREGGAEPVVQASS